MGGTRDPRAPSSAHPVPGSHSGIAGATAGRASASSSTIPTATITPTTPRNPPYRRAARTQSRPPTAASTGGPRPGPRERQRRRNPDSQITSPRSRRTPTRAPVRHRGNATGTGIQTRDGPDDVPGEEYQHPAERRERPPAADAASPSACPRSARLVSRRCAAGERAARAEQPAGGCWGTRWARLAAWGTDWLVRPWMRGMISPCGFRIRWPGGSDRHRSAAGRSPSRS